MSPTPTIWITGLSRSGKTTLAEGLARALRDGGTAVEVLDGSSIREEIGDFLGYSRDERMKVSRIMCSMANLLNRNKIVAITTSITPYQESRDMNRSVIPGYFEVYLDCSLDTCMARDDRNNYARALRGDLKHFIGVEDPFEVPKNADLTISTDRCDESETLDRTVAAIEEHFGR